MRVCVLAFDGLEYRFAVKWRLRDILQEYNGRYTSLVNPAYGKPYTPTCWASFITGRPLEEHGVRHWWTWGKILDWLRFKPPFRWFKGKSVLLRRLGFKPKVNTLSGMKTIFDLVKPSIGLFIPSYSEPMEYRYEYIEAGSRGLDYFTGKIWEIHRRRRDTLFKKLVEEWVLLMCWFDLVDLLSHAYQGILSLMKGYFELNRIARRVRSLLPRNTALLIVSDHGVEFKSNGVLDHSSYGFWSLNVTPPFTPRRITDFFDLIVKLTGR